MPLRETKRTWSKGFLWVSHKDLQGEGSKGWQSQEHWIWKRWIEGWHYDVFINDAFAELFTGINGDFIVFAWGF